MRKVTLAIAGGAALVLAVIASGGAVASGAGKSRAAAKPGPDAVLRRRPAIVWDNSALSKPGVTAGTPRSVVFGKTPPAPQTPDLNGYVVVNSGDLSNPAGRESGGAVYCPPRTVPFGGGVFLDSTSTLQNINSSLPTVKNDGWARG
jgi:hypothetical protein